MGSQREIRRRSVFWGGGWSARRSPRGWRRWATFGWTDVIDLGDISTACGAEMLLPIWLRLMSDDPLEDHSPSQTVEADARLPRLVEQPWLERHPQRLGRGPGGSHVDERSDHRGSARPSLLDDVMVASSMPDSLPCLVSRQRSVPAICGSCAAVEFRTAGPCLCGLSER